MILDIRLAKLGGSINGRTENHGDELMPAFDIPLLGIMLSKQELIALKGDATVWDRWYNEKRDGLAEPADRDIEFYSLNHSYEACEVRIVHALSDELYFSFDDSKLSGLKCICTVGGNTELRCTLKALIEDRHGIYAWMGKDVRVELGFGSKEERAKDKQKKANPELPLNHDEGTRKKSRKRTNDGATVN